MMVPGTKLGGMKKVPGTKLGGKLAWDARLVAGNSGKVLLDWLMAVLSLADDV